MLGREDFDMWLDMLTEARGWRKMGEESRDIFLDQLNKYGPTPESFGDHCAKIIDAEYCQPNEIIRHFKERHFANLKQQALPQANVKQNTHCDGFVRFTRLGRELKAALAKKKKYPAGSQVGGKPSVEFQKLWNRPLTDEDHEYAEQRRQSISSGGPVIDIPLGG